jgi:hypothetical protein
MMLMAMEKRMMPKDVLQECRQKVQAAFPSKKIKSWAGAAAIACLWALAIYVVFRFIRQFTPGLTILLVFRECEK